MKIVGILLGLCCLLLVFNYMHHDHSWQWLDYHGILIKAAALIAMQASYSVYLAIVFGDISPSKKQLIYRCSSYLLLLMIFAVVLYDFRMQTNVSEYYRAVSAILLSVGYMLIYNIYLIVVYGFMSKDVSKPLLVRVGNHCLDMNIPVTIPALWFVFPALSLFNVSSDTFTFWVVIFEIVSFVSLFVTVSLVVFTPFIAPLIKKHQTAQEAYFEQHPDERPLTEEQLQQKVEREKAERLASPSKVNENIAKHKSQQREKQHARALARKDMPWWQFWRR